jgi:hypothetical protein
VQGGARGMLRAGRWACASSLAEPLRTFAAPPAPRLLQAGFFPDVVEGLAHSHLRRGDEVGAPLPAPPQAPAGRPGRPPAAVPSSGSGSGPRFCHSVCWPPTTRLCRGWVQQLLPGAPRRQRGCSRAAAGGQQPVQEPDGPHVLDGAPPPPLACPPCRRRLLRAPVQTSALVACEWGMRANHFPGWGRPYEFAATIYQTIGKRDEECRDTARCGAGVGRPRRRPWAGRLPWGGAAGAPVAPAAPAS